MTGMSADVCEPGAGGELEGLGKMGAPGKAGLEKRGFALFSVFILVQ